MKLVLDSIALDKAVEKAGGWKAVAAKMGVTRQSIQGMAKHGRITLTTLARLADATGEEWIKLVKVDK